MFYIDTIIRVNTPIPAKERILRALTIVEMVNNNELTEITTTINLDKLNIDSIFMIAANSINSYQEIEFLLDQLYKRSPDIISSFFRGFKIYPDNLSLMIDRVWLNESKKDDPDWNNCINVFSAAMKFAKQHGNQWLLAGAARGIIIIYDEYLDDSAMALKMVDEVRSLLSNSHPLIDFQEATVHFRAELYKKVIEITNDLESSLAPEVLPIHRIHALRRGIQSAGNLKLWDKVIFFAQRGLKISQFLIVEGMEELAPICFEAEIGWGKHEKGNIYDAAKHFESVLNKMERFSNQQYPLFHIFRLRFCSALSWLSHTWKMNGSVIQLKTSVSKPFAGMFANFEDPPEESKDYTVQAYPILWVFLAKYSASQADKEFIDSITKRTTVRIDGEQYYFALMEANYAIFLNALVKRDFNRAFEAGIEYAKLFVVFPDYIEFRGELCKTNDPVDLDDFFKK
jgi:hypothetical protein